jgi:hypothetical protein
MRRTPRTLLIWFSVLGILHSFFGSAAGQNRSGTIQTAHFVVTYDRRGITGLWNPQDRFQANLLSAGGRLGEPIVIYRVEEGDWLPIYTGARKLEAEPEKGRLTYTDSDPGSPLKMVQWFQIRDGVLDWIIEIETTMDFPVLIGDLALPIPWRFPSGPDAETLFERSWTKHHFIAGHGSFLYFVRPSGEPPYVIVTVHPGTKLEYFTSEGRGNYRAFIHSGLSGGRETRGTWRQPHTFLELKPAGVPGSRIRYGVRFQWARSYAEMREILYREGLFDIRVVPGMTVPEDLTALLALHTRARIEALEPEFPGQTRITYLGEKRPDHHVYRIAFARLGENRLTIRHDGDRRTHLEFFVTEPLEILIKKRSRFITRRQQHRDPSKWYNGLYSIYDMKNKALRGPDDTDGFDYWWGYVLASDDPVLGKASFVAAKNVHFPDPEEIASVEYHIENFVWGGLQRTDREQPYPYGVYGVPNWKVNRDPDPKKRAGIRNRHLDKMPIWRSFDYPHLVMLYFHMYEIARKYPRLVRSLDALGYLERAYQTARAYFLYPYEILPEEYETYKIGCYNELVIVSLIAALEKEGFPEKAAWLRNEWEKKVKYFIYDDTYPYRSEYPFDRTAFETTYAVAKYGATVEMKPDRNLWFDKKLGRWYSHPVVRKEDALAFMQRQLKANLAVRGWLEAAYYLLGADFTGSSDVGAMSYMAAMGGWAILDYALHFAPDPADWLQLGYASFLSSWSLMNTGRPETNYGFWFPGPENDGAAGWQFMTAKFGRAWIRKEMPRGAWHYDGEIDLGYGGALRAAATILTQDPLFGWFAYGGTLTVTEGGFSLVPRDGLRKRFFIIRDDMRLGIELDRDGFSAERPIFVAQDMGRIRMTVENRTADAHVTLLRLSARVAAIGSELQKTTGAARAAYAVVQDGRRVGSVRWGEEAEVAVSVSGSATVIELIRMREGEG